MPTVEGGSSSVSHPISTTIRIPLESAWLRELVAEAPADGAGRLLDTTREIVLEVHLCSQGCTAHRLPPELAELVARSLRADS